MELVQATKTHETTYSLNDAMNILLSKLDDAIDDVENGRFEDVDVAFEEIVNA